MSTIKKLTRQLKKIQQQLTLPYISFPDLEDLSIQTRKNFDEALKRFMAKHDIFKKVSARRDFIRLWQHRGKQIYLPINWRYILSIPFIYGMFIPAVIWNIGIEIYHQICFRLYGIPLVNSSNYFVYDRQLMSCLNWWEKFNCYYCSYVNNLVRYSAEIGGLTERYWCPIKYVRRVKDTHSQYAKFIDIQDEKTFREEWSKLRNFSDISQEK
jgi:hypothetical protein